MFFLWGSLCIISFTFAYFLVPVCSLPRSREAFTNTLKQETKGLSLEQVDQMMDEVTPRKSAGWKPHTTFAEATGLAEKGVALENDAHVETAAVEVVQETIRQKSVV